MSFGHSDFLIHKIGYRKAIRHAKHEFKIKLEGNFTEKNPRILWKNRKEIMHLNAKYKNLMTHCLKKRMLLRN